ncbi:MAG TPA: hypothetical protein VFZ41_08025 [Solirubrobacterales bacterium]
MPRLLFLAAVLALIARMTVFAEPDTVEAFVSFAAFWALAAGCVIGYITS